MKFFPGHLSGLTAAPASKSESHRKMICAGLTAGTTTLTGFMDSEDMAATIRCLKALGTEVSIQGDAITLTGSGQRRVGTPYMDCGESGSTLRFLVPIAMTMANGGVFQMHGRLGQRPMDVYRDLFVPRGASWWMGSGPDGAAELHVQGRLNAGNYVLPGNVSSQFVSGLLFSLPMLSGDSRLQVKPPVESSAYIDMTVKALLESGITLQEEGPYTWVIPGNQRYHAVSGPLTGDYSQGAVYLCAAALGNDVKVTGLEKDTVQGDRAVIDCLQKLGAVVTEDESGIAVKAEQLHGATLDMSGCPDIAPIVALTCQLAGGTSRLTGCGRLKLKECDRLEGTVTILNQLGGCARVEGDTLVVEGVDKLKGGVVIDAMNDHRMVMLASIAALRCDEPIVIQGVEALHKSWPAYLDTYKQLGGHIE
ncbi:MAG: 3-phosphoshikimate 1-carboxyvinyltransferase [Clostridia bacterium]|nr:3-phosphoshikimate 1-carboxyvinyltransferase [Clostridia bacterium]